MPDRKSTSPSPPFRLMVTAAVGKDLVPYLRKHLRAAHGMLRPPLRELSVALVGDRKMSELHERFMNIAGPTDVLSFPLDEDARGRVTSGEVVVCVPEARRRARAEKTDLRREALLYALHGMLHLSGFDDLTPAGFARMHRKEDQLLTALGIGAVFGKVSGADADRKAESGRRAKSDRDGAAGRKAASKASGVKKARVGVNSRKSSAAPGGAGSAMQIRNARSGRRLGAKMRNGDAAGGRSNVQSAGRGRG